MSAYVRTPLMRSLRFEIKVHKEPDYEKARKASAHCSSQLPSSGEKP